jgi:tRNA pseudouridine38-40 synthase
MNEELVQDAKPYKIVVSYDGTAYHGWQEQAGCLTIAGVLQTAFEKVFRQTIKVVGASRTDAGVHALGQVARFYTSRSLRPERFLKSWNNALPTDIHIRSLEPIIEKFHPQHNVATKTYYYHFFIKRPLPHYARYGYHYTHTFDEAKLRACLECFIGTHNFGSFCAYPERQRSTICTLETISLEYLQGYNMYRVAIRGNRFLHNMIRRMVGCALKVASSDILSLQDIQHALAEQGVYYYVQTAPAHGLVLRKILYRAI